MRKRGRLANKLTIMVCAVLVAVSAFFYAPMEVSASGVNIGSNNIKNLDFGSTADLSGTYYQSRETYTNSIKLSDLVSGSIISSDLYKVKLSIDFTCTSNVSVYIQQIFVRMAKGYVLFAGSTELLGSSTDYSYSATVSREYYLPGSFLLSSQDVFTNFLVRKASDATVVLDGDVKVKLNSIELVHDADAKTYQEGYNAGYSAGEDVGYDSGYSSGYNEGYSAGQNSDSYDQGFQDGVGSVDTDSYYDSGYEAGQSDGYDTGFEAGKDSVDIDAYYQAGYNAGYQAAYSLGYEEGYDEAYDIAYESGYNSAMDRIANWGADTSDYPLRIGSGKTNGYFSVHVGSDIPFNYRDSESWRSSNDYNPNHTYKYVINFSNIDVGLNSDILYDYWSLYLNIGGIEYNISPFNDSSVTVFIPGDRISTTYSFDWVLYNCVNFVSGDSNLAYLYVDYDFVIYDMGPSGDTQNHIANQTDQLTNGFDESQGNSVNSDLSTGLNEYQTAEDSLWATATTGLKDFTFFDFESVPAMITGMSFITSIMGSWFSHAGGASGVGIVLSILFSVMLVAMVLGLYRLYQSKGGKN